MAPIPVGKSSIRVLTACAVAAIVVVSARPAIGATASTTTKNALEVSGLLGRAASGARAAGEPSRLKVGHAAAARLASVQTAAVVRGVPLADGSSRDFVMQRFSVFGPDTRFVAFDGHKATPLQAPSVTTFQGTAVDDDGLVAFLAVTDKDDLWAIVRRGGTIDTLMAPSMGAAGEIHVSAGADVPAMPIPPDDPIESSPGSGASPAGNAVPRASVPPDDTKMQLIAIDVGNDLYVNSFNSDTADSLEYVGNLMAAVGMLYIRDLNIALKVLDVVVWTTPDPFTGADSLSQFNSYDPTVSPHGYAATYLLLKNQNLGGRAWLGNSQNCVGDKAVCNISGWEAWPIYNFSFDTFIVGHELGHTSGSVHTHCYTPPIDMCANESGCYSGPVIASTSEIMSYCSSRELFYSSRVVSKIRSNVGYCLGTPPPAVCGNRIVEEGEQCDDGNTVDGDCCSSTCQLEGPPGGQNCDDSMYCTTDYACSDGTTCLQLPKDCDDGNPCTYDSCDEIQQTCVHTSAPGGCDDGEFCTWGGYCFNGTCIEVPRPCDDFNGCTTDSCDEVNDQCINTPLPPATSCFQPGSSVLLMNADRKTLVWKWLHGEATQIDDFGLSDLMAQSYSLCLYDGSDNLVTSMNAQSWNACPFYLACWKTTAKGFIFTDRNTQGGGMFKTILVSGAADKSKAIVKGKGSLLNLPGLPAAANATFRLQLRKKVGSECWESSFTPPFTKNDGGVFKDRE